MMKREDVCRAVNESLARFQTEYIDLFLVHWPAAGATEENPEGMKEKNPEYRKLAWDELTQLFKFAILSTYFAFLIFLNLNCALLNYFSFVHYVVCLVFINYLFRAGKLRAIGISNYTPKHIRELLTYAAVKPTLLQSEYHPYVSARQRETVDLCRAEHIVFQAHSPLGGYTVRNIYLRTYIGNCN